MSNSKRILAALLAGAMVLCAGCGKEEETEEESSNSTAVEVTDVTSGAMSSEYTLNGKIAAVNEVQVFPLLAGQVQTLNVSEGDTVSKGQTLFTVDTSTVTSTMSSLQQSYSATKTATDRAIESAKIDGAGEYTIFFKMVLPLSKPVISALGIFTAVGTWNDYTQTLYYTKSADIQTLSYYMLSITKASASAASLGETMSAGASSVLTTMSNSAANYKTIELACMVLSALPLIIVYPFAQKFFEKGVMVGSVKG